MRTSIAASLLLLFTTTHALAQTAPAASSSAPVPLLQAVTVTGVQPGPGLWKVSKGDHVMWVLGTLTPLPKHMEWRSAQVEDVLAHSQLMLGPPGANVKADVGFFGKLLLLPSAYSARKNPDGASLQQILPPAMYTQWQGLKQKYIGHDSGIEYWRPLFVALKLYQKALDQDGLTNANDIGKAVEKMADAHGVRRESVKFRLVIEHPRDALNKLKQTNLHDISCFNQTLDLVQNEMGDLTERANAWSTGDVETLQRMALRDRHESCVVAVVNADFAEELGLHDLPRQIEDSWMAAAQNALATTRQSFALLPMDEVLAPDGYLAHLKAKGYTVQAPDDQDP